MFFSNVQRWRILHVLCCVYLGSKEYRLFDLAMAYHLQREKDALASPA